MNGVAFFSTTESFNEHSDKMSAHFLSTKPFDKNETEFVWKYLKLNFPNDNKVVNRLTAYKIFDLTGFVPRHVKCIKKFYKGSFW
jgi:hypothetical protein